jgi:hypothetical protein
MPKPFDVVSFLSSVAMTARKAGAYAPETSVVDMEEIRQIINDLQENSGLDEISTNRTG